MGGNKYKIEIKKADIGLVISVREREKISTNERRNTPKNWEKRL
jgi:hypothetical protein